MRPLALIEPLPVRLYVPVPPSRPMYSQFPLPVAAVPALWLTVPLEPAPVPTMMSRGVDVGFAVMVATFAGVELTTASSKSSGAGCPLALVGTRPRLQLPGLFQLLSTAPVQTLSTANAAPDDEATASATAAPRARRRLSKVRRPRRDPKACVSSTFILSQRSGWAALRAALLRPDS